MRLGTVFRFEAAHRLRQPATWFYLVLLLGLAGVLAARADPEYNDLREPLTIVTFTLGLSFFGILVTAALFVEAAHRDVRWRMEPLFRTAPLGTIDYLGGRFLGALLVNALLLLAIPCGLLIGSRLQGAGPAPPLSPAPFALAFIVFLLPNLLINAALLFGLTVLSRRTLPAYLGALGLLALFVFTWNESAGLRTHWVLPLVDPTGGVALATLTRGWTRAERASRLIGLDALLLWNRLLWMALAGGILACTALRFRRGGEPAAFRRRRMRTMLAPAPEPPAPGGYAAPSRAAQSSAGRTSGVRTRVAQTLAVARMAFRQTTHGRDFLVVTLGVAILGIILGAQELKDPIYEVPLWPLTGAVAAVLVHPVMRGLIALLTVFLAGELVWREREAGVDELRDTRPIPDAVLLAGTFLALAGVLVVLQAMLMAAGIGLQAFQGYRSFEIGLYLETLFGMALPDYLLFAVLALVVHVVVNQKYIGHLVVVLLVIGLGLLARTLAIDDNLLLYGSDPGWIYSDLGGFGGAVAGFVWFKLYWAGWALLLGMVALLFLVRGTEGGLCLRLRKAHIGLTRRRVAGSAAAAAMVLGSGGFIFYNTHVQHEQRTGWELDEVHAQYERLYKRFEHAPQPWLTGMRLYVEIYPRRRELTVHGSYRLVNRTTTPIDSVHLSCWPDPDIALGAVHFDRPAAPALRDAARGYHIFALTRPLLPGDSLRMDFAVRVARRGFRNRQRPSANTVVLGDFTHVASLLLLPAVGYQRELGELSSAVDRRAHGLPPTGARPRIDDAAAQRVPLVSSGSDWIDFEATVGTAPDQVAVLPGMLRRSWLHGGRRYFQYRAEAPIPASFGLISGRYAVHRARSGEVEIRILYYPTHAFNLDRMVGNARAALEYLSSQFGPYPHRQLWMLEFPRYGEFARAYPGQLLYSETNPVGLSHLPATRTDTRDPPLLVTAHEIAHQWWGKQVLGADVHGAAVLSETLAQYTAAMVLERVHGAGAARRFLYGMHMAYLDGRTRRNEVPLLLSTGQEYIHYRKGAVVMYALREYLGEERVNAALRQLLREHAMRGPPYPTALDLYKGLRAVAPDSLRGLVDDLFTTITLWDLRTTRAEAAPLPDGRYRVTLDVEATKLRADGVGREAPVRMDDPVEIGVFAGPGDGDPLARPLYLGKQLIHSGHQTITVIVSGKPVRAGVDPYRLLIARHPEQLMRIDAEAPRVRIIGARDRP